MLVAVRPTVDRHPILRLDDRSQIETLAAVRGHGQDRAGPAAARTDHRPQIQSRSERLDHPMHRPQQSQVKRQSPVYQATHQRSPSRTLQQHWRRSQQQMPRWGHDHRCEGQSLAMDPGRVPQVAHAAAVPTERSGQV